MGAEASAGGKPRRLGSMQGGEELGALVRGTGEKGRRVDEAKKHYVLTWRGASHEPRDVRSLLLVGLPDREMIF